MKRYNKKYDSAEKAQNNIKYSLLKISDSLPLIWSKYIIKLWDLYTSKK